MTTAECLELLDWTVKESVRARLRVMVRKILKKHGYPLDKQAKAIETVISQAELLCEDWASWAKIDGYFEAKRAL